MSARNAAPRTPGSCAPVRARPRNNCRPWLLLRRDGGSSTVATTPSRVPNPMSAASALMRLWTRSADADEQDDGRRHLHADEQRRNRALRFVGPRPEPARSDCAVLSDACTRGKAEQQAARDRERSRRKRLCRCRPTCRADWPARQERTTGARPTSRAPAAGRRCPRRGQGAGFRSAAGERPATGPRRAQAAPPSRGREQSPVRRGGWRHSRRR